MNISYEIYSYPPCLVNDDYGSYPPLAHEDYEDIPEDQSEEEIVHNLVEEYNRSGYMDATWDTLYVRVSEGEIVGVKVDKNPRWYEVLSK